MKRNENFYSRSNKKLKLDQDIDDIWGDDPPIEDVDRCFDLATQYSQDTKPNNTLNFTTYDDFKKRQNIYASTQAFLPANLPSTSGIQKQVEKDRNLSGSTSTVMIRDVSDEEIPKLLQKIQILESEKKKLTEMNATKNGEITILRSQLKQVQKTVDNEKMEKLRATQENQQKWDRELNLLNKELTSNKCELNLKNLEIANLREKLVELKKVCNNSMNMTILNEQLNCSQAKNKMNGQYKKSTTCKNIQTEFRTYPVTSFTISVLPQRFSIPDSFFLSHEKSTIKPHNNFTCISHFYSTIQRLLKYSSEELNNSKDVLDFIDTIFDLTTTSLIDLKNKLCITNNESTCDIENISSLKECKMIFETDCIFSGNLWHKNETAVEIRRYIAVLSYLVMYCDKLCKYFIVSQNVIQNEFQMDVDNKSDIDFLNLLLEVVTVIEKNEKSDQFCGFLSSVLKFLENLSSKNILPDNSYEIIIQIFIQIIFGRLNEPLLKYVVEFLKVLSNHKLFVVKLCFLKQVESMKDGLLYYSEDKCLFNILSTELGTCKMDANTCLNIMEFLMNLTLCNSFWMCHQEEQRCECLIGVYSLGIEILFNTLKKHSQINKNTADKIALLHQIFQNGLIFLDILTVRIPDVLFRYSRLLLQFETIVKYIFKIQKSLCLQKDSGKFFISNIISNRQLRTFRLPFIQSFGAEC